MNIHIHDNKYDYRIYAVWDLTLIYYYLYFIKNKYMCQHYNL